MKRGKNVVENGNKKTYLYCYVNYLASDGGSFGKRGSAERVDKPIEFLRMADGK
jgi:hypothetical protein